MEFVIPNITNCIIEMAFIFIVFMMLKSEAVPRYEYSVAAVLSFGCFCVITFVDSVLFSVLPFNYLLVFLSFCLAFRSLPSGEVFWNSLIAYLWLIYLQVIFLCLYPVEQMGPHQRNFVVNGSILACGIVAAIISKRFRFREYYARHRFIVRVFFLALCLPEFVIGQFVVSLLMSASKVVFLCFALVQVLYVTLLLLVFVMVTHKQERRQFEHIKMHVDTLNHALDESKSGVHDFNKHIRYLQDTVAMHIEQGNYEALGAQVNDYCEELLERSEKQETLLHIDDPVLRALLYGRHLQAASKQIEWCTEAATTLLPSFPLTPVQMVELFDNLMENALECVETMKTNRWVRVTLSCERMEDGRFRHMMHIQNPYETLDLSAMLRRTSYTSKKGNHHGIGLKKAMRLADDTGGKVLISHGNCIFSVKVVYELNT